MSEERRAGVPYEVAPGVWAAPIVPPPGQQRTPLAEVDDIPGRRVVYCGPTGHEWGLFVFGEPIMGRDLALRGESAAKNYVGVVSESEWFAWRFQQQEPDLVRYVPLYACWLDPYPTRT